MYKFFIVLLLVLSLKATDTYKLGEGLQIANLPIYIGGYISLDYKQTDKEDRYRFDDIAILSYGNYEKLSYMLELEYKEFYVKSNSKNLNKTTKNFQLYTERLYIDYNYNENYLFRIGKYNSPIGFWNLLPINVLKETTSTPLSNSILFPTFTTGVGLSYLYYGDGELKIDFMLQNNNDFDAEYNNYKTDKHYGIGLSYAKDDFTIKLNSGFFHKNYDKVNDDELYYYLVSAKYENDKFQVLSEFGQQFSSNETTTHHAGYIQGTYHLNEHHNAIMRVESYEYMAKKKNDEEFFVLAYTYRPLYPVAFKSEYQFHKDSELNQFLFSISVLF